VRDVNEWTLRQWSAYQEREVPCADCAWLLYHLVADHNATTGVTHPGDARLHRQTRRSKSWVTNHKHHLERDGHIVLVRKGRWRGHEHDAAAEYALPWLRNEPPSHRRSSPRIQGDTQGDRQGDTQGASSVLRTDLRTGAASASGDARRTEPDDAIGDRVTEAAEALEGEAPADLATAARILAEATGGRHGDRLRQAAENGDDATARDVLTGILGHIGPRPDGEEDTADG
jgi:hypothetical protein